MQRYDETTFITYDTHTRLIISLFDSQNAELNRKERVKCFRPIVIWPTHSINNKFNFYCNGKVLRVKKLLIVQGITNKLLIASSTNASHFISLT